MLLSSEHSLPICLPPLLKEGQRTQKGHAASYMQWMTPDVNKSGARGTSDMKNEAGISVDPVLGVWKRFIATALLYKLVLAQTSTQVFVMYMRDQYIVT